MRHIHNAQDTDARNITYAGLTIREMVAKAKDQPCADCGRHYPGCMEMLHVRGTKKFSINKARYHSRTAVLNEIDKCIVICPDCREERMIRKLAKN